MMALAKAGGSACLAKEESHESKKMNTRYFSLLGLGFGDCGKGLFTDYLARQLPAHTVVRFNGGAQAGHNVVLPDGRHHTFSQFSAGSFVAGVYTVLSRAVVVHPSALLVENQFLQALGVDDGLPRMLIDARCRVTTPFHQAAGRIRELARGAQAHGSCGVGVGETVADSLSHPEEVLHYGELRIPSLSFQKLEAQRLRLLRQLGAQCDLQAPHLKAEAQVLQDGGLSERWLQQIAPLLAQVHAATPEQIAQRLQAPGAVLFEGAQGVLLDEWRGFHPHTTWSTISSDAVEAVLRDLAIAAPVTHFGILRSYLTRHGAGPFPTWDRTLDKLIEPHNAATGWQGQFKRGQPDQVLLRYALQAVGKLDGLLLSHMDVFARGTSLRWCEGYQVASAATGLCLRDSKGQVRELCMGGAQDLAHQEQLNALLKQAVPCYAANHIASAADYLASLQQITACPAVLASYGPTWQTVQQLSPM